MKHILEISTGQCSCQYPSNLQFRGMFTKNTSLTTRATIKVLLGRPQIFEWTVSPAASYLNKTLCRSTRVHYRSTFIATRVHRYAGLLFPFLVLFTTLWVPLFDRCTRTNTSTSGWTNFITDNVKTINILFTSCYEKTQEPADYHKQIFNMNIRL